MAILALQRKFRELGRLRTGRQVPSGKGTRPEKLEFWRLTSASKALLDVAAEVYGGEVTTWENAPTEGPQYELFTTSDTLRIAIPPGEVLSQWLETWRAGGCVKRCDGQWQVLRDVACSCPKDREERAELAKKGKACSPATRLSVILPDIPDVGIWRLEVHGWNAAEEMLTVYSLLRAHTGDEQVVPARLRIDQRQAKKLDENDKSQTHKYTVPVLEFDARPLDMSDEFVALVRPPVQRRALPGTPPPVSTDPGEDRGAVQPAEFPAETELPEPPTQPEPPDGNKLPKWILTLPGTDGDIIDAANAVNHEGGGQKVIKSVAELVDMPEHLRQALAARLENPNQEAMV